MSEPPLTIVWRRQVLEAVLETAFIRHVLLAKIERPQRWMAIEEGDRLPLFDNTLIVSFGDPVAYFDAVGERGIQNVGFFQVGDEKGDAGCRSYDGAAYVLRNYHFAHQLARKPGRVSWVPNGWARAVGPVRAASHLSFAERTLPAFFSGFVGQDASQIDDRQRMLKVVEESGIAALMATTSGFGLGLGPAAYGAHMGNARFALVPHGRSPETIRFYDALEMGAIPITIDGAWMHAVDGLGALGPPPVVMLKDWSQLPAFMAPYQGQASRSVVEAAEQQRLACVQWWQAIKDHYGSRVARLINGATGATD